MHGIILVGNKACESSLVRLKGLEVLFSIFCNYDAIPVTKHDMLLQPRKIKGTYCTTFKKPHSP